MQKIAYIALGTNLPYRGAAGPALLEQAIGALQAAGLSVEAVSTVHRTPPWPPGVNQPDYFNAAAAFDAGDRTPPELYDALRGIEASLGRVRRERWGPRTLDLDILAMAGFAGTYGTVTVPHPRMHERAFVLAPLAEIAPDWVHPLLGKSVSELLRAL